MRKFIAAFLVVAFAHANGATPYHWECGTFTIDATDTLISCPQISTNYIYFTITNTGSADIHVRQIINSSSLPAGWSVNMCNPNGCWGSNVLADTFLVPASSYVIARFDFHADTTIGSGVASVRFDDSVSPIVNGATFNLHAVSLGTSIEETPTKNNTLVLYPNPVLDKLVVGSSEFREKWELKLFNILGEQVFSQPQTSNFKPQTVDVSQLPPGIYFVKMRGETGEQIGKFIKAK